MGNLEQFLERLKEADTFPEHKGRPFITVTYAQGVDGSIALPGTGKIQFSGQATQELTHRLRAAHDGILLGIDTVLADNPLLTVRLVAGSNPRPIVLDTHLRIQDDLRLMERDDCKPVVMTGPNAPQARIEELNAAGTHVMRCPLADNGRVDLQSCLKQLATMEPPIKRLMVEGGARVISAFTAARLVDFFIITVTPCMLGGIKAVELPHPGFPYYVVLNDLAVDPMGGDVVLWARPTWRNIRDKLAPGG